MLWTDRIRQVKLLLVSGAIVIAIVSLVVSHILTCDLSMEERQKMEVWAEAMSALNRADQNTDLGLVLKVMNGNNTIPVVVMDNRGEAQLFRNVEMRKGAYADSLEQAKVLGRQLKAAGRCIRIQLNDSVKSDYVDICYGESLMLKQLQRYPYVQLGVVMLFVVVAIFALLTSKRAEQDKVWVGLSKETAHQLGTPISSLMAWTEMLKETYPQDDLIPEMDKDVKRLELIADRFSKIGSLPELVPTNMAEVLSHVVDYMDRRTSNKVRITMELPDHDVQVMMNGPLFEWVLENLCKNAVDAMAGERGSIVLHVEEDENSVILDVTDTGKGIRKRDVHNVFRPGFTTKKRGWGLGLSLARRIIEEYHKGRISVKASEVGVGTTFRIVLPHLNLL